MGAKVKIHFMYATRTIKYISKRIKKALKLTQWQVAVQRKTMS